MTLLQCDWLENVPSSANFFSSQWTCLFLQHGVQALYLFDVGLCDIPAGPGRAHNIHDLPSEVTYIFPPPAPSPFLLTIISKANSPCTIVRLHLNSVFTWHLHTGHAGQLSHSRTRAQPASIVFDLCSTPSSTDPETARRCLEKLFVLLGVTLMPELVHVSGEEASECLQFFQETSSFLHHTDGLCWHGSFSL